MIRFQFSGISSHSRVLFKARRQTTPEQSFHLTEAEEIWSHYVDSVMGGLPPPGGENQPVCVCVCVLSIGLCTTAKIHFQ